MSGHIGDIGACGSTAALTRPRLSPGSLRREICHILRRCREPQSARPAGPHAGHGAMRSGAPPRLNVMQMASYCHHSDSACLQEGGNAMTQ
jgi:hypothetical protein